MKVEIVRDILPNDIIWSEIIESLEENQILQREIQTNRIPIASNRDRSILSAAFQISRGG